MCDILIVGDELALSFCSGNSKKRQAFGSATFLFARIVV
nr:MAG TPA: hypothetical protein [Caudoviricetes sp.]